MSVTPHRTISTRCSTKRSRSTESSCLSGRRCKHLAASSLKLRASRAGGAADVHHVSVTDRGILVDETRNEDATVERYDLPILFAAGRSGRADIVLPARATLQAQFLRRRLIGLVHQHTAGRPGSDHVRLLALRLGGNLGTRPVGRILV